MKLNPIKLDGVWTEGYALDYFTENSEYVGEDIFGYPCLLYTSDAADE